jgi:hypothetical protein
MDWPTRLLVLRTTTAVLLLHLFSSILFGPAIPKCVQVKVISSPCPATHWARCCNINAVLLHFIVTDQDANGFDITGLGTPPVLEEAPSVFS